MKKILLTVLTIILSCPINGQPLSTPQFMNELVRLNTSGELRNSSMARQLSSIGEYHMAMKYQGLQKQWGMDTLEMDLNQLELVDPEIFLNKYLNDQQIVIISEAHQKPQHRIFTTKLLDLLYKKGFRYLGMETLMNKPDNPNTLLDSLLNDRGYPLNSMMSGTYTLEPQMSNIIRKATDLGFILFAYERFKMDKDRDLIQAENIKAFLDQNPNAKIVIHCGWYHAVETNLNKGRKGNWMAYHLKELTGIDPVTIYQDLFTEEISVPEAKLYQHLHYPDVAIITDKETGNPFMFVPHFDIQVYHPRTKFLYGRPMWMFDEKVQPYLIPSDSIKMEYPVMVEAYGYADQENAVPLDRMEIQHPEQQKALALPTGNMYRIRVFNMDGMKKKYVLTH